MTKDKIYWIAAMAIGAIVGTVLVNRKNMMSGFDGDDSIFQMAQGEPGLGGTADTTQTTKNNMPMHQDDLPMGNVRNSGNLRNRVSKFWKAFNSKPGTEAHDKFIESWFKYKHPGVEPTDEAQAEEYFRGASPAVINATKVAWAKQHGIRDPKAAIGFWSNSKKSGSPEQMMKLFKAFYPTMGNRPAGDVAFTERNDV